MLQASGEAATTSEYGGGDHHCKKMPSRTTNEYLQST